MKPPPEDGIFRATIGIFTTAVFLVVAAVVAIRVAQHPVSTLGVGVALEATISCEQPSAARDAPVIVERFEALRIDAVADALDPSTIVLRLGEDPGGEALEGLLGRGDLAIFEIVEARRRTPAPARTAEMSQCDALGACAPILVRTPAAIRGSDVADAQVVVDPDTDEPYVAVTLTHDGARALGELTTGAAGRRVAIAIDGQVLSAPVVREPIHGGRVSITLGSGNRERRLDEARRLAITLNTRPLDCAWRVVSTRAPE